uniref:Uncharacterized protein n=1 Tax=Ackermannviridae sp. TaxID=2831612 RepID=A0A8S5VPY9_9CAUD|nr:MAG TPA: hypothetical protein [Ackermannviridae sp.]
MFRWLNYTCLHVLCQHASMKFGTLHSSASMNLCILYMLA